MSKFIDLHSQFPGPEKPPVESVVRNEFYSAICSYATKDIEQDLARYNAWNERAAAQATSAQVELHLVKDYSPMEFQTPEEPLEEAS